MINLDELRRDAIYNNGEIYWHDDEAITALWPSSRRRYKGCRAFKKKVRGYLAGGYGGKRYYAHQIVWLLHNDTLPKSIDHINGDKFDNRIENLRASDSASQLRNMPLRCDNKSGVTGVRFRPDCKNKWLAEIYVNGRGMHLGCFATKEEAIQRRKAAEAQLGFSENHGRIPTNPYIRHRTRKAASCHMH